MYSDFDEQHCQICQKIKLIVKFSATLNPATMEETA